MEKNQSVFKKEAVCSEFPFLQDVLEKLEKNLADFDRIDIRRADRLFLFSVPDDTAWDGCAGEEYCYQRLFSVKRDEVLEVSITPNFERGSNYSYSQTIRRDGDTYLSSLYGRFEDADFYVLYHRQYTDWQGSDVVDIRTLTVLKPPKGFTVLDCIEEAKREEAREVAKELDAVNSKRCA